MRELILAFLVGAACLNGGCAYMGARFSPEMAMDRQPAAPESDASAMAFGGEAAYAELPDAAGPTPTLTVMSPRKVIYAGLFNVAVGDVDSAVQATRAMAERMGGYMLRMKINAIAIRIPAERFDSAVAEIAKLGAVIDKDITARDVTDQYLDLEMRLRNAKALQKKLVALLEKSQAVRDTLEIEKELQRASMEIERLEGQIKKLSHEVAYSTLTVTFTLTRNAPAETRVKLPFRWLESLGLDELLAF